MPELVSTLLPLLAIFVVFWLLIIRPQSRRTKALQSLRASLNPGDRVMMTAGIYGTLRSVEGDRATIEVADGTLFEIATGAIATVEPPAETPAETPAKPAAETRPETSSGAPEEN